MNIMKNGLAIIGALSVAVFLWAVYILEPTYHRFNSFDEKAAETYITLFKNIMKTGNAAEATVWKMPVAEDLKAAEVEEVMKFVANEHNIKDVGELPLYKQVEASTGKPFRFMKIYMFCNALTAAKMVRYSDAFSAYLPCRVTLLEDKTGKLWLYSLNMDLKKIILDIMKRGASGEF